MLDRTRQPAKTASPLWKRLWGKKLPILAHDYQPSAADNALAAADAHERTLEANIYKLRDLQVADVMTPRANIVAADYTTTLDQLLKIIVSNPFSRIPIYRETVDDILGFIHIKDILDSIVTQQNFDLSRLIRQTKIVSPSMSVMDLMLDMRQTRTHMAMVIDEYGGIDGLVTIEDLLEQIVGEIEDEQDVDQPRLIPLMDGAWLADGRLPLETLEQNFNMTFSEEERENSDTVAGLVAMLSDHIPVRGEIITHPSGLSFDILESDKRRVLRVRIRSAPVSPHDE